MGFNIEATVGTAIFLREHGIRTRTAASSAREARRFSIPSGQAMSAMSLTPALFFLVFTMKNGVAIRRCACENNITMLTALDTVRVLLDVLEETTIGISTIDS